MVDKFYTIKQNVDFIYSLINLEKFDLVIEPSAGDGVFLDYLLHHNIPFRAYDIEPHHASIQEQDFLTLELDRPDGCNILTIGNPPFGTNNSLAIRFFNKAAEFSSSIALILPKSFRKPSVINRLDRHFHLIADVNLPTEEYRNGTNLVSVPTFFQVWDRGNGIRSIIKSQVTSDKIAFVGQDDANYTIRRVGAKAGSICRCQSIKTITLFHLY